jgi:hypothetical protein
VEHWLLYWTKYMNEKWEKWKRNCFTTCAVIILAPATKAQNIMYIIHYHNTWSLPVILVFVAALTCYIAYLPALFCETAWLCKLHHFYLWYIKSCVSCLWLKVARAKHWPHATRLFYVRSILLRAQIFMTISESNDILHAFWVFTGSEIWCCKHTGISDLPKTSSEHACHVPLLSVPVIVNLSWFGLVWSRIYILVLISCLSLDLPNGVFPQCYPTHLILD